MASGKRVLVGTAVAVFILLAGALFISDSSQSADSTVSINYVVDSGCGSNSPDNPSTYTSGSVPLADAVPNEGYRFAGWYVLVSSYFTSSYRQIADFSEYTYDGGTVNVYAYWYYTVDVDYVLGEGTYADAPASIMTDEIDSIGNPISDDRRFYKWSLSIQPDITSKLLDNGLKTQTANTGVLTCTAQWYYNINYVLEDCIDNPNPVELAPGYYANLADVSREGYDFLGWYDESDNKVVRVQGRDCTLTAKWKQLERYSITFDLDGGTLIGEEISQYYGGSAAQLPSAEKDGYYFNGWMIDGERSNRIESITTDLSGDLTLSPWWIALDDIRGHGYVLDYTMRASQGIYYKDYSDSHSTRYYEYDSERGFFVVRTGSDNTSTTYWTNESDSDYEFTYLGMQEYELNGSTYLCEVYEADYPSHYEKQYICDGWVPVCIEFRYTSGWTTYAGKYTLSGEVFEFDTSGTFGVRGCGEMADEGGRQTAPQRTVPARLALPHRCAGGEGPGCDEMVPSRSRTGRRNRTE